MNVLTHKGRDKKIHSELSPFSPMAMTNPVQPVNSTYNTLPIQAECACGGGCPRCLGSQRLQTKLTIGQPNDKYELEADRVADQVVHMPEPGIQRQSTSPFENVPSGREEEGEEEVRTKAKGDGNAIVLPAVAADIRALRGGGQSLPMSVRRYFEPRFGYDFRQVRLHTNKRAARTACTLKAQAFTLGNDVVFGAGQYAFKTFQGRRLLAHELTHVVQQRSYLQRQPAPSLPTTSSTGWNSLPSDAQRVLTASFNHYRNSGKWLWKHHTTAADCFDKNLKSDRQHAFRNVYDALNGQGLWNFVQRVIEVWPENVQAIKFDPKPTMNLRTHLQSNTQFCKDPFSRDPPKWRQVVTAGSPGLHIITPGTGAYEAHIDRIAPVRDRKASGECDTAWFPEGMQHLARDKWGFSRSSLMLGATVGLTTTRGGIAKGLVGLDVTLGYRFLSLLGNKLRLHGELKGELNNLFASGSLGLGIEAKFKMLNAFLFAGGIAGDLTPGVIGEAGTKLGAGISTSSGLYLSLSKIALLLGVKYQIVKDLVNKDPMLHRLMVSAKIRFW